MKKTCLLTAFAAVLSLSLAVPARANDDSHQDEDSQEQTGAKDLGPCKADAAKLCPGLKPGDGKFGACMKEHQDDASDECKAKLAQIKDNRKQKLKDKIADKGSEACGADAAKFCSGMKAGDGKWGPCLKEHKDDLSKPCKRFMARVHQVAQKHKKGGQDDGGGDQGGDNAAPDKSQDNDNN